MEITVERVAELERANYAATATTAQVTPGLDVVLRDDVILTSSQAFPTPDTNHACLLQATSETADDLIAEVVDYFRSQELSPTVYVSPACTPDDLPERLSKHGFARQASEEAWMALKNLSTFEIPSPMPGATVRSIEKEETLTFAEVFLTAFNTPTEFAPYMVQLLKPSIGLPNVHHYLAFIDGEPVGTCSLLCHETFGILGSTGVTKQHRRSGAATNLTIQALTDAREQGVETVMLQTEAGTLLARYLRISGFVNLFTRTCYTTSNG